MKILILLSLLTPSMSFAFPAKSVEAVWKQVRSRGLNHDCEGKKSETCGWVSQSRDNQIEFRGSEFIRSVIGYSDLGRRSPAWDKKVVGTFVITNGHRNDVSNLELSYKAVHLTAFSQSTASVWNRIKFCGHQTWTANVSKNVTGLMCDPLPMRIPGSTYYTSIGLQSSKLYFANDSEEEDGSSPQKRPTKLDLTNPFTRKN